jgi:hypothetical protein
MIAIVLVSFEIVVADISDHAADKQGKASAA